MICTCCDFREYETMASSKFANLADESGAGLQVAKELCGRLGQEWVYLPVSYDWEHKGTLEMAHSDLLTDFDSIWKEVEMDQLWQKAETALETLCGRACGGLWPLTGHRHLPWVFAWAQAAYFQMRFRDKKDTFARLS